MHCPTGEQFSYISVTPVEDIMRMERKIIDALDYRLCVVSVLPLHAHSLPVLEVSLDGDGTHCPHGRH